MSGFVGIALCGKKGAGKDTVAEYLQRTRENTILIRCKTPIVREYERITGKIYNKGRDDAELIRISRDVIRKANDEICAEFMHAEIPGWVEIQKIPIIPDMRRLPETRALKELGIMCIMVSCDEEVRLQRIIDRDGDLRNYDANDVTEKDVDTIHCPYEIDNSRNDRGVYAFQQLESYLSRQGSRFAATADWSPHV